MEKENCIFCMIAKGEISSFKIYEDEYFSAFLDLNPASKGHTLLIPRMHAKDIFDLPDETAKKVLPTAKKIGTALKKALDAEGLNICQNNGECAGQTVGHFHVHLIPRKSKDNVEIGWTMRKSEEKEQKEIMEKIRKCIENNKQRLVFRNSF